MKRAEKKLEGLKRSRDTISFALLVDLLLNAFCKPSRALQCNARNQARFCRKARDYMEPVKTPQADGCEKLMQTLVVLDTNAVLDWLVFAHPACADWHSRMAGSSVRWLVTEPMRSEMKIVLDRDWLRAYTPDPEALWTAWSRFATPCDSIQPSPDISRRLRCTDRSDQKFIDLAVVQRAQWLITRDRALLKLASPARLFGLVIAPPEAWTTHPRPERLA